MNKDHPFELLGAASAMLGAQRFGVLQALVDGGGTLQDLANERGLSHRSLGAVLEVLRSVGLARRDGDTWLCGEKLDEIAHGPMASLGRMFDLWGRLPEHLQTGDAITACDGHVKERGPTYSGIVGGLGRMFAGTAARLAVALDEVDEARGQPSPGLILDVGAGSAVWSLEMLRRHPDARVMALDLPEVLPRAEERARAMGLEQRLDLAPGDFIQVLPRERFHRVLLANVLHLEPAPEAGGLVRRFSRCLAPGGALVIVDSMPGAHGPNLDEAVYALHLTMRTDRGEVHPRAQLCRWLEAADLEPGPHLTPDPAMPSVGAQLGFAPS